MCARDWRGWVFAGIVSSIFGMGLGLLANVFQPQQRLTLWFSSPNDCGAVLAILSLLVIGCMVSVVDRHPKFNGCYEQIVLIGLAFLYVACNLGLGSTGSRGGALALFIGIVGMSFVRLGRLYTLYICIFSFSICFFFLYGPIQKRALVGFASDYSYACRADLLLASLCAIADRPWGLGGDNFGDWITGWYLQGRWANYLWEPLNQFIWTWSRAGLNGIHAPHARLKNQYFCRIST
jgi:hypothetical protein